MTNTEPRSPFTRRGFIAAAIVVGIIVLAAIIVLVTTLTRGTTDTPKPTTTASASTAPTGSAADKSVCGLTGLDAKSTLTEAPDSKWELVGTVAAPTDPLGSGPGISAANGFRSCFAHTAKGALYATANMLAMGSDARLQPLLADKLAVPGPGRDVAMKAPASDTKIRYQIAGYKITAYNKDEATVDLAVTVSSGQTASVPFLIRWSGGDWKAVLTDQGQPPLKSAPLQNLGGYTPWAGA